MNKDDLDTLFAYDRWAWDRLLAQVAQVSAEQYVAPEPVPHGSLRGTLVHAVGARDLWLRRWQGNSPTALLSESDLPTFQAVRDRQEAEGQKLEQFLGGLTDEKLNETLNYKTTKGAAMSDLLWHLMAHLVNHGTQHRSEAAILVTEYGFSPGNLDLLTFLREAH